MLTDLLHGNTIYKIDTNDLQREFNQKYEGRFVADSIFITSPEEGISQVAGKATAVNKSISLFGLTVHTIDFTTRQVHFIMSPVSFSCVRDALLTEILQERKQS